MGVLRLKALPAQTARWLDAQRPSLPAPALAVVDRIEQRLDTLGVQFAALDEASPAAADLRRQWRRDAPDIAHAHFWMSGLASLEARLVLDTALDRLTEREQQILRWRFEDERTQQEIADLVGLTQAQVSRTLTRILGRLRTDLSEPLSAA